MGSSEWVVTYYHMGDILIEISLETDRYKVMERHHPDSVLSIVEIPAVRGASFWTWTDRTDWQYHEEVITGKTINV